MRKKPGPKPKSKVKIRWSPNFAYAIGLITTDGNLSSNGRHIDFTSKDIDQIKNFMKCLNIVAKIGKKQSGFNGKYAFRIQFGDVNFYKFLLSIGLMPKKSRRLGALKIPAQYFFDFLRGHFDGDGSFFSYWDPRWKSSFMFYTEFTSASPKHIHWLRKNIAKMLQLHGHISQDGKKSVFQLKYAKKESLKLLKSIYGPGKKVYLERKYRKIQEALKIQTKIDRHHASM